MKYVHIYSVLLFVLLIAIWEFAAGFMSELVLPAPSVVVVTLFEELRSGHLFPHLWRTTSEVLLGLLYGCGLGFTVGLLMGENEFFRRLFLPYVIASQAVPKLALAPLFVLWFDFGMTSKVVITALICFFPLLENTATSIQYVDSKKLELFKVLRATKWQTLIRLKIPAGLPNILAGLRVAVVLAVVGAVVGEFIGASKGLGAMIIASQGMMETPLMFAILVLLTLIGMALYQIVNVLEKILLKHHKENE